MVTIISQSGEKIFDFSNCLIELDSKSGRLNIKTYYGTCFCIGYYADLKKAEYVFNKLIEFLGTNKLLFKPHAMFKLDDLKAAKDYYEDLNNVDIVITAGEFDVVPLSDMQKSIFKIPKEEEVKIPKKEEL